MILAALTWRRRAGTGDGGGMYGGAALRSTACSVSKMGQAVGWGGGLWCGREGTMEESKGLREMCLQKDMERRELN